MQPKLHHTDLREMELPRPSLEKDPIWFRIGIGVDIKFGVPKFNCRFHGICKLDLDENDFQTPFLPQYGKAKGRLFIPHRDYGLICFFKKSMTTCTIKRQFSGPYFEVKEPPDFSEALLRKLQRPVNLDKGCQRIRDKGDVYSVLFRLKDGKP